MRDRLTLPKHAATYNRDGCLVFLLLHVHDEYLITWALTAHDLEDIKIQIEIQCIYLFIYYVIIAQAKMNVKKIMNLVICSFFRFENIS